MVDCDKALANEPLRVNVQEWYCKRRWCGELSRVFVHRGATPWNPFDVGAVWQEGRAGEQHTLTLGREMEYYHARGGIRIVLGLVMVIFVVLSILVLIVGLGIWGEGE